MSVFARLRARVANTLRLERARRMHKTVRFKVGDLTGFYTALNEKGTPYCVLRWADDVPFPGAPEAAFDHDIDHLIGRHVISDIKVEASLRPGRAKCDFYSINGERGTAYAAMPYLTPALAATILANRVRRPDQVFYTPNDHDAFFSFAYHLVYHKGVACGIDTGFADVTGTDHPARDYGAELRRLAGLADIDLPQPLTLLSVHMLLRDHSWNMPLDLMVRWPRKHAVLKSLMAHDRALMAPLVDAARGLYVFVLRAQERTSQNAALARDMIATRFDIVDEIVLTNEQATDLARLTRGGNWYEKSHVDPIPPTDIIVCREGDTRGPLPDGMSAEKIAKRYPHLENTDVLIKREVRNVLRRAQSDPSTQTSVHATDNAVETAETLQAVFGARTAQYISTLD